MKQIELHDLDAWRAALAEHPRILLFKHSPVCPVSTAAHSEWVRFGQGHTELPTLFVDVIHDKPTARGLATECGVAHASPQVILFVSGEPVWDASHGEITAGALDAAWSSEGL